MKNVWITRAQTALMLLFIFGFLLSCNKEELEQNLKEIEGKEIIADKDIIAGSYIVIVSKEPSGKNSKAAGFLDELTNEINKKPGASVKHTYKHVLTGFAAKLTDKHAQELARDPRVKSIEHDHYFYLDNTITAVQEYVNWGLDRIDQREGSLDRAYAYTGTGKGVTVYVMDTGIRASHVEFGDRASFGYDFSINDPENDDPAMEPGEDCYGHGTPVAGIIGGMEFGVAKDVNLVNVKVFSCKGGAAASTIVAAVDWVTQNAIKPAIVNASFGYPATETAVDIAVANSIETGIHYAVSAGNSNDDACQRSPAGVTTALTVGASNILNEKAYFSSYGDCVDVFGPGLNTTTASQLDDTSSRLFSGTSAAAPYVAGVMALYLENNPEATPAQVHAALLENSTPNAVTDVPSGPNNMIYSLWEPVEFVSPIPVPVILEATAYREKGRQKIDLSWNVTDASHVDFYKDGQLIIPQLYNDGEQSITGSNGKDGVYTFQVCESGYNNCSKVITVIFGDGDGSGGDITNELPKANFTYTTNLLQVQFTDTSTDTDGSVTNWSWNFGDGNTSSTKDPVHSYSAAGTYEVALTVTDDAGDTNSTIKSVVLSTEEPDPGTLSLSATGYKVKGVWHTDLSWNYSGAVDIYRDGEKIVAAINSSNGTYTDVTGLKGGGSLNYKICEAGSTANCSNEVTVQF